MHTTYIRWTGRLVEKSEEDGRGSGSSDCKYLRRCPRGRVPEGGSRWFPSVVSFVSPLLLSLLFFQLGDWGRHDPTSLTRRGTIVSGTGGGLWVIGSMKEETVDNRREEEVGKSRAPLPSRDPHRTVGVGPPHVGAETIKERRDGWWLLSRRGVSKKKDSHGRQKTVLALTVLFFALTNRVLK